MNDYGQGSPGLLRIADTFESSGFRFVSYADYRWQGKQIGILRISDGSNRYGVFGTKDLPVGLARFDNSGKMILIPIKPPKRGQDVWDAVVHAIRRSVKLN